MDTDITSPNCSFLDLKEQMQWGHLWPSVDLN